jgi:hypothetical protein
MGKIRDGVVLKGNQYTYQVLFLGVVDNSQEGKKAFLREVSKRFHIPHEKVDHLTVKTPLLLKSGLSLTKAEALVREFESLGGRTRLLKEERPLLELECNDDETPFLFVGSITSSFQEGRTEVIGRVKNISSRPFKGVKVVAQFFDSRNQFVLYEEAPIAFTMLKPNQYSPFRVIGKGKPTTWRISVAFKGEDGAMITAGMDTASHQTAGSSGEGLSAKATRSADEERTISVSQTLYSFMDEVFSRIPRDQFTMGDIERVIRDTFPEQWALLERKCRELGGLSTSQYLSQMVSRYIRDRADSIEATRDSIESGLQAERIERKGESNFPPTPSGDVVREFDGKTPLRNFGCPKLNQKSSSVIARALIKGYNEEKIPHDLRNFNHLGFNAKSLVTEEYVLLRFLSLILFERWPFRPWEMVWDEEGGSIHSLLRNHGLFEAGKIRRAPLDEIESKLRRCVTKGGRRLHTDGGKTHFARTLKELALHVDGIASSMKSASTESDLMFLHQDLMHIHGFSAPIAARCIAYALRELGAGKTSPGMFEPIARFLKEDWRASDWGERLEFPILGGRSNLFDEVIDQLSDDPLAFDYLSLIRADYCQDGNCEHCFLG